MRELIKKELKLFFTSLSGYVILATFLFATGLFLWVVPGVYNIPESGMADLQPFFSLAPVLYLFLVPALCMRLFAEERRAGTLELLLTRPIALWKIIAAKYLSGLLLVLLSILPTFIYPLSLSALAQPEGYIDTGGIIGSYFGLIFLAAVYVAAGVWASSLTDNQVVAFLYALLLSFLLFSGFDFIAEIPLFENYRNQIVPLGINYHYEPMSRGLISLSDVVYFLSVVMIFLFLTSCRFQRYGSKVVYFLLLLICVNWFAGRFYLNLDITNDKRYTLSENTRKLLENLDKPVKVEIFLAGNLPPAIQRIQHAATAMLDEFNRLSDNRIQYVVVDPAKITKTDEKKQLVRYLADVGINPVNLSRTTEDEQLSQQIIFPGIFMYNDEKGTNINLLKNIPGYSPDENINYSVEILEYDLTNALRAITNEERKSIGFLTGQGEYTYRELEDIATTLSYYYQVDFVNIDTVGTDISHYSALIIAGPSERFSEKDKYIIDQYLMQGGRLLWCIDEVDVRNEKLYESATTYAIYKPLNVEDMFFKYGLRVNPDVVIDGNCAMVKINTALIGNPPQYATVPWYFSPLVSNRHNPITSGLLPIRLDYANSIDTLGGSKQLKKTVILTSSQHAALVKTPAPISLYITEEKMSADKFNRSNVPVAVMVEGIFPSLFQFNRRYEGSVNESFRSESLYSKIIVVADGDVIRNKVRGSGENTTILPLGYDDDTGILHGNKDFILNVVNTLCDDDGWMELRGRNLSMYLLNKTKLKSERNYWQMLNLLVPFGIILVFGGLYSLIRKYRYTANLH
ncbi:MAG: gliding motility-associated ABC transporter substrate-binding protein GldG [Culturomica sp.]|jgi:ABC-2 type transport system permease protein|nr:gliding motility-associated ABC transporter substrate-binding protein GldG [Culturomica sp.]